jgi:flagellin
MKRMICSWALAVAATGVLMGATSTSAEPADFLYAPNGSNFMVYGTGSKQFIINQARLTEWKLGKDFAGLASGKRIVTAADDPAGLAVADRMDALIRGLAQESMNEEDMRNYVDFLEGALGADHDILMRIRELALRASNGILGPDDRELIQSEVRELVAQVDMNAKFTQFNRKNVMREVTAAALGVDAADVARDARGTIALVDAALRKIQVMRTGAGVKANVLTFRIEGRSLYMLNLRRSESRIRDLDMAEGVTSLMKNSVMMKTQYGILLLPK